MGGWFSSSESTKTEQKVGTINNGNIVIHESIPIHNDEIMVLIYLILGIIVLKLALKLYKLHNRRLQRKFRRNHLSVNAIDAI